MNRRSIAQEYYILAVDKNGNMPPMRRDESNAGLVAAGFMDLLLNEIIAVEIKKVRVIKDLSQELQYLSSLYEYLKEKPRSVENMIIDFNTGKRIRQLIAQTGEALFEEGVATVGSGGIFGAATTYIPENKCREELVEMIKSVMSKELEITSRDVALICILQESKNLKQYFSNEESNDMKARLKEIKKDPQNQALAEMVNYVSDLTTIIMCCILVFPTLR